MSPSPINSDWMIRALHGNADTIQTLEDLAHIMDLLIAVAVLARDLTPSRSTSVTMGWPLVASAPHPTRRQRTPDARRHTRPTDRPPRRQSCPGAPANVERRPIPLTSCPIAAPLSVLHDT